MPLATKARPGAHHKKRQAKHHRRSKDYLKPYWPYIPLLLIISAGFALGNYLSNPGHVLGTQSSFNSALLLSDTNQDRTSDHESNLLLSSQLDQAAQAKANDMVNNNYWAHVSPSGKTPWTFIIGSGYKYSEAGENLAYGFNSSSQVISAWMASPEHRANMLKSSYSDVGFGIAESPNFQGQGPKVIVVAEYAKPLAVTALTNSNLAATIMPSSQSVSRIQVSTSSYVSEFVVVALVASGGTYVILRHGLGVRKLVKEGEVYIASHPLLDILIVAIFTFSVVYSHSAGFIS
jgi:hypothetical protein